MKGITMRNAIAGLLIAGAAFATAGAVAYGVGVTDDPPARPIVAAAVINGDCTEDLIEYSDRVIQTLGKTLKLSSEIPTASTRRLDEIQNQIDAGYDQYMSDLAQYNATVDRCGDGS